MMTIHSSNHAMYRLSLWPGLALGLLLALQACSGLASESGQFRSVPGTSDGDITALAINTDGHFSGHIAFVRNHQLYTLSGKDGKVSALPTGLNVQDPAYSPDGSRLAYIRQGASWSDLMVISLTGGAPTALTHNQGTGQQITCANGVSEADAAWAANPIWSLDGSTLYYLSDAQKLLKTSCGFVDMAVWKIGAQGGKAQFVLWPERGEDNTGLPGAGGDADLSLRPGKESELSYTHYAYDTQQDGTRLVQIFLAPLDQQQTPASGQQEELALTPAWSNTGKLQLAQQASWSPNGQFLAYIMSVNGTAVLAIMRVGNPARGAPDFHDYASTLTFPLDHTASYSYPVWSPDGKSLLYLEFKNNEYNLYLAQVTVNGSALALESPIQLTRGGVDGDSRPAWTAA
jgi:Tol biopolymer transport system component